MYIMHVFITIGPIRDQSIEDSPYVTSMRIIAMPPSGAQ
jgi:hypothetical protein